MVRFGNVQWEFGHRPCRYRRKRSRAIENGRRTELASSGRTIKFEFPANRWRHVRKLTLNFCASSRLAVAWYDNTSKVTLCFAIATTARSYMCVLWIPIPQNIANASTKFSSFFENGRSSNLLISCMTPIIWPVEFFIAMQRIVLCLKQLASSTLGSKRGSSSALGMFTVWGIDSWYEWGVKS